jgi:predicted oxidoreductase (fatty acid repression mutant protein)
MAKKDVYGSEMLPEQLSLESIKHKIKDTDARYTKVLQRMRILDGADRGKLWDVVNAKFPKYQLTPDSNWINYIKEN